MNRPQGDIDAADVPLVCIDHDAGGSRTAPPALIIVAYYQVGIAMDALPLAGKRIVITRAEGQADALAAQLRAIGAEPLIYPLIDIIPPADLAALDTAIAQLETYDWLLLTSANGARALLERMTQRGRVLAPLRSLKIGAVGAATAEALRAHGLAPQFVASAATAETMVAEIGDLRGQRVLLPCADIARATLPHGLRARGATVDEVIAYRTVPGAGLPDLLARLQRGAVEVLTFFSPSAVRYLLDGLAQDGDLARILLSHVIIVCIGPTTADAARRAGLRVDMVAEEHTSAGVVAALVQWFAHTA